MSDTVKHQIITADDKNTITCQNLCLQFESQSAPERCLGDCAKAELTFGKCYLNENGARDPEWNKHYP